MQVVWFLPRNLLTPQLLKILPSPEEFRNLKLFIKPGNYIPGAPNSVLFSTAFY